MLLTLPQFLQFLVLYWLYSFVLQTESLNSKPGYQENFSIEYIAKKACFLL